MDIILNMKYDRKTTEKLYCEAFPKSERKPFDVIVSLSEQGKSKIYSIENINGDYLGLAITLFDNNVIILDYFAIAPSYRSKGIGGAAIEAIKKQSGGKKLLLEVEATDIACENAEQRIRRKNFYTDHGFKTMPFKVSLFGELMEIMAYDCEVNFNEYFNVFKNAFPKKIYDKIKVI